jgi:hypothetical protein
LFLCKLLTCAACGRAYHDIYIPEAENIVVSDETKRRLQTVLPKLNVIFDQRVIRYTRDRPVSPSRQIIFDDRCRTEETYDALSVYLANPSISPSARQIGDTYSG